MVFLEEVYKQNKILDDLFSQIKDNQFVEKNKIELIQEIGEMVNETRCFKYWSNKPINYDLLYEEYADCLIMILYFFHLHNMNLNNRKYFAKDNIIDEIGYLYKLVSDFYFHDSEQLIRKILYNIIYLGEKLNLDKDLIKENTLKKINKDIAGFKNA